MQTTIFSLIDLLTNMSGTTNSYESLQEKIEKIDQDIPNIKEELEDLKNSISPDKYFDASSEIVDRNIEISVNKKISSLEKELLKYQKEMKSYNKEQNRLYENIDSLKQKIIKAKGSCNIIESRTENTSKDESKKLYENLAKFSVEKIEEYQKELKEKQSLSDDLEVKINELSSKIDSINTKLEKYRTRLEEVKTSLSNKSYYINEELKQKDTDLIKELENKIKDLTKQKEDYLNDPTILASEIKGLFASNSNEEALEKLRVLVNNIKEKPYMDVTDTYSLETELERLQSEQNEQTALIENKKYMGSNIDFLNDRIDYINILIDNKKDQIKAIEGEINIIDTYLVENASKRLRMAEKEASKLSEAISNYYDLINSEDQSSIVTLNNLKMSHDKKCNELKIINDLIQKYELELTNLIRKSNKLENDDLVKYQSQIKEYEKEINSINNLVSTCSKTKDIIEQENDKKKLRDIIENIKQIKKRLSFKKSPDEIYDEIEMWISSNSTEEFDAIKEYQDDSILKEEEIYNDFETETSSINSIETSDKIQDTIEYDFPSLEETNEEIVQEEESTNENVTEQDLSETDIETTEIKDINEKIKSLYKPIDEDEYVNKHGMNEAENVEASFELPDLNNTINFKNSYFKTDEPIEPENEETSIFAENKTEDIVTPEIADDTPTTEYSFSELEDTGYFNLDDFLRDIDNNKE